jgi:hypothetical protein
MDFTAFRAEAVPGRRGYRRDMLRGVTQWI